MTDMTKVRYVRPAPYRNVTVKGIVEDDRFNNFDGGKVVDLYKLFGGNETLAQERIAVCDDLKKAIDAKNLQVVDPDVSEEPVEVITIGTSEEPATVEDIEVAKEEITEDLQEEESVEEVTEEDEEEDLTEAGEIGEDEAAFESAEEETDEVTKEEPADESVGEDSGEAEAEEEPAGEPEEEATDGEAEAEEEASVEEPAEEESAPEAEPTADERTSSGEAKDPLTVIHGIGPKTAAIFEGIGITNIGELVTADIRHMVENTEFEANDIGMFVARGRRYLEGEE